MIPRNYFICSTTSGPCALRRALRRAFFGGRRSRNGFTLVEIAIVLVIIALMLGFGVSAYMSLMETRKIAKAQSMLKDARACLFKRALVSERYPSYTAALVCAGGGASSMDVDDCICPADMLDPWGQPIRYLEGVKAAGTGFAGEPFVSEVVRGQTRVAPGIFSLALNHKGILREDVAFVLISYGGDGLPDDTSYGNRLTGVRAATLNIAQAPDFETGHVDDIYLVVTSAELATAVLE